ncbi:hypothetical protein DSO57_1036001 [Entomophthora muscae]|uniref:Uncharacterized protein n=1 Tax=Entomophthora muscae TaxID=34485 RepID=A0ACC2U930_9FUNG|nr:hypothetical protein DSO57_1036001 [Entomophthora muscae]
MEFTLPADPSMGSQPKEIPLPHNQVVEEASPHPDMPVFPEVGPNCTSWLTAGMLLMGLNTYLPQLSPTSFLWTPVCASILSLNWMASWWVLPPG